jgi:putative two-component system response regulator
LCGEIARGAPLHDAGKIGVPDVMLLTPGDLDPEESAAMRKSADVGFGTPRDVGFLRSAPELVRCHHAL